MRKLVLNNIEYEVAVLELKESGDSTVVLRTIVEEGETSEKKYRINLARHNPLTLEIFKSEDERIDYTVSMPDRYWDEWYEDPEPLPHPEGGE
tara:strand:+ start:186 stop:464 length:279 start_codon:yes stop_codon:yes gene_type:complete